MNFTVKQVCKLYALCYHLKCQHMTGNIHSESSSAFLKTKESSSAACEIYDRLEHARITYVKLRVSLTIYVLCTLIIYPFYCLCTIPRSVLEQQSCFTLAFSTYPDATVILSLIGHLAKQSFKCPSATGY